MIKLCLLLTFLLSVPGCASTDVAVIREAEAKLVLPVKADPLSKYNRYYAITGRVAKGIFIWSESGKGSITVVPTEKNLPFVADGGCGVIQVRLNLETKSWDRPFCHGS